MIPHNEYDLHSIVPYFRVFVMIAFLDRNIQSFLNKIQRGCV
jgi:hypothetical protein